MKKLVVTAALCGATMLMAADPGQFSMSDKDRAMYMEMLEHKARRRDLLVDQEQIYAYYDKRIPDGIYTASRFERWLKKATAEEPKLLHMRLQELLNRSLDRDEDLLFPERLPLNGIQLPLAYRFVLNINNLGT